MFRKKNRQVQAEEITISLEINPAEPEEIVRVIVENKRQKPAFSYSKTGFFYSLNSVYAEFSLTRLKIDSPFFL